MNADFEKQLQCQPLRELPRDWRAKSSATATDSPVPPPGPRLRAWAALAAVWVVIFLLHLTAPDEPRLAGNSPAMTMRSFAMLHEQTLMMASFSANPIPPSRPPAVAGSAETPERNSAQTTHRLT